jgi:hypothetical protein
VVSINLEIEQIDAIVVDELKQLYEQVIKDYKEPLAIYGDEAKNLELIVGIRNVLEYYMPYTEFEAWINSFNPAMDP